jgi:hypothetical protein
MPSDATRSVEWRGATTRLSCAAAQSPAYRRPTLSRCDGRSQVGQLSASIYAVVVIASAPSNGFLQ